MSPSAEWLRLIVRKARTCGEIVRQVSKARRVYGAGWGTLMQRFAALYFSERYSPKEIFLWGLIDPAIREKELCDYVSKDKLLRLQRRINAGSAATMLEHKSVFYPYCMALGVPVPRLFAIVERDCAWTAQGKILPDGEAWRRFIETEAADLVVKPSRGVYAQDVWVLQRRGPFLIGENGEELTTDELLARIRNNRRYDSFIVQQRIRNHPVLEALSGTRALQTLRMVTAVESDGDATVLLAELRIICGTAVFDNFVCGSSRNLLADIDLSSGRLGRVIGASAGGLGTEVITHHPQTGREFSGLQIPHWTDAVMLLKDIALKFLPMRTIGWDVAITADGPVVIEGNAWWDPGCINAFRRMNTFNAFLERNFPSQLP
jgi:Sugar-transfer associated ATP-grasp